MTDWRDTRTDPPPKDGTMVLAWFRHGFPDVVQWSDSEQTWHSVNAGDFYSAERATYWLPFDAPTGE